MPQLRPSPGLPLPTPPSGNEGSCSAALRMRKEAGLPEMASPSPSLPPITISLCRPRASGAGGGAVAPVSSQMESPA